MAYRVNTGHSVLLNHLPTSQHLTEGHEITFDHLKGIPSDPKKWMEDHVRQGIIAIDGGTDTADIEKQRSELEVSDPATQHRAGEAASVKLENVIVGPPKFGPPKPKQPAEK